MINDGDTASEKKIYEWLELIGSLYSKDDIIKIMIHCIAALGRAPMMVCIALIVCENMDPYDAVEYMRHKIHRCLNQKQVKFLLETNWNKYKNYFKKYVKHDSCIIL